VRLLLGVFAVIADDRLDAFGFDFTDYVAFSRDFWRRDKRPCVILTDLFHLLQLAFLSSSTLLYLYVPKVFPL
jgi:hypothetical protein